MTVTAAQVLPVPEDADALDGVRRAVNQMQSLINEKAWTLLGLTAQEFSRAWYSGEFVGATDPATVALDTLMRTGRWTGPA